LELETPKKKTKKIIKKEEKIVEKT